VNRAGRICESLLWLLALAAFALARALDPARAGSEFEPAARARGDLRVVTWNVGGSREGTPHALLDGDVEAVARALNELEPDLVLLQEFSYDRQWPRLRRELERGEGWVQAAAGVAIIALRGELHRGRVRAGSFALAEWRVDGRALAVATIHAHPWSARRRNTEVGSSIEELLREPAPARLFAGDFNLDVDLDKRGDLLSDDLRQDVATYNYVAERLEDAGRDSGPTAEPDRRLDYLFLSPELRVVAIGPWKGRRRETMDHDPLVADLRWR
jgi:endonuclease/exonuclease/phosphatase family metal-dependent hydrolase